MTTPKPPILHFDPDPVAWADLIDHSPLSDEQLRFREQLGLPTDRPIIFSGHQPTLWHPGIFAKHLVASALADSINAHSAWLVVEHVTVNAHSIDYPATPDAPKIARLPIGAPLYSETIAARTRPLRMERSSQASGLTPEIDNHANSILTALTDHADADSLAHQFTRATNDLLAPFAPPLNPVYSKRMVETDLFAALLDVMRADPIAASQSHNDALRATPGTGVAPMHIDPADPSKNEIPLWVIRDDGSRRKASAEDLHILPPTSFAPRVLFNTALLRLAGADLFVHGTGGAAYDKASERWFQSWLGKTLSPAVMASADMFLPIEHDPGAAAKLEHTNWRLHHARHNPGILSDDRTAQEKRKFLNRIAAAREQGEDASPIFREMHAMLALYRDANATAFQHMEESRQAAAVQSARAALASRRDWAFPLYPPAQLEALHGAIRARFAPTLCSAAC